MRALIVGLAMMVSGAAWAQSVPQFSQFSTGPLYGGPRSSPDLSGREAYDYRTRLRAAAPEEPNFASDHRLVTWGCGTSCQAGAVINQRSGRVVFFPFSICCSKKLDEPGFNAIEFRRNSALIIFSGLRNEEGVDGTHFYEFNGRGFHFLHTSPIVEQVPPSSVAPAPPLQSPPINADAGLDWIKGVTTKLGYCVKPKVQYGQYSSFDGGKSALNLGFECPAETSTFLNTCETSGSMGDDPKSKCALMFAASVQLMIKEMGK